MKQFAILVTSSTPSLKNIAQISSHSFGPNWYISMVSVFPTLVKVGQEGPMTNVQMAPNDGARTPTPFQGDFHI